MFPFLCLDKEVLLYGWIVRNIRCFLYSKSYFLGLIQQYRHYYPGRGLNTSVLFYFKGENYHEEQDKICKRRHFKRNERHC